MFYLMFEEVKELHLDNSRYIRYVYLCILITGMSLLKEKGQARKKETNINCPFDLPIAIPIIDIEPLGNKTEVNVISKEQGLAVYISEFYVTRQAF